MSVNKVYIDGVTKDTVHTVADEAFQPQWCKHKSNTTLSYCAIYVAQEMAIENNNRSLY